VRSQKGLDFRDLGIVKPRARKPPMLQKLIWKEESVLTGGRLSPNGK